MTLDFNKTNWSELGFITTPIINPVRPLFFYYYLYRLDYSFIVDQEKGTFFSLEIFLPIFFRLSPSSDIFLKYVPSAEYDINNSTHVF